MAALVVALALSIAAPAVARDHPDRGQWLLSTQAGAMQTPGREGLGSAVSAGAAVGYGLTQRLTAEVSYRHWRADHGQGQSHGLSGIWSLPRVAERVRPYVSAGGGVMRFDPDGRRARWRNQWFGGIGAFGDLGPRVSWRVDVRAVRTDCSDGVDPAVHAGLTLFLGNATAAPVDADSDGDGVPDGDDQCADTVRADVDSVGCPLDDDGDGVPNWRDACRSTPHGTAVDGSGCVRHAPDGLWIDSLGQPLTQNADGLWVDSLGQPVTRRADGVWIDSLGQPLARRADGVWVDSLGQPVGRGADGVWIDSLGQPVARRADGVWVDSAGRPLVRDADGLWVDSTGRPVARESDGLWVDSSGRPVPLVLLFEFDESTVGEAYVQVLRNHAAFLRVNGTWTVRVEGHADARGAPSYNRALGERRARAVRDLLVSSGVPADRVVVVSHGEDRPVRVGDDTSNRRAVVIYLD